MSDRKPKWFGDRLDRLRALASDGLSATQIARKFGDVSRLSIIGVCDRHKISLSKSRDEINFVRGERGRGNRTQKKKDEIVPPVRVRSHEDTIASFAELAETACKWPIGDPSQPGFHFCGDTRKEHSPYCQHHHSIAYEPYVAKRQIEKKMLWHIDKALTREPLTQIRW